MLTDFGKALRIIRINSGESMRDMANKFGISPAYLSAIENGKRSIPDNMDELVVANYQLSENETQKLKKAILNSSDVLKINLASIADSKREVFFALSNDHLDDHVIEKLCEIIQNNKK